MFESPLVRVLRHQVQTRAVLQRRGATRNPHDDGEDGGNDSDTQIHELDSDTPIHAFDSDTPIHELLDAPPSAACEPREAPTMLLQIGSGAKPLPRSSRLSPIMDASPAESYRGLAASMGGSSSLLGASSPPPPDGASARKKYRVELHSPASTNSDGAGGSMGDAVKGMFSSGRRSGDHILGGRRPSDDMLGDKRASDDKGYRASGGSTDESSLSRRARLAALSASFAPERQLTQAPRARRAGRAPLWGRLLAVRTGACNRTPTASRAASSDRLSRMTRAAGAAREGGGASFLVRTETVLMRPRLSPLGRRSIRDGGDASFVACEWRRRCPDATASRRLPSAQAQLDKAETMKAVEVTARRLQEFYSISGAVISPTHPHLRHWDLVLGQ